MIAPLILATALLAAEATTATPPIVAEDIPVPGGLAALAQALGISPIDRATAVAELSRLVLERDQSQRLMAHLESVARTRTDDLVPMPLTAALWSQAVFKRPIARDDLFAAVMSDKPAALLARGLAALDDETLRYVASRRSMVTGLYQQDAGVLAAFAAHLRIHDNRVVAPGGDTATPLWEAVVGERITNPEAFVRALFSKHSGRLAYLYDVIAHVDPARQAFALGTWIGSAEVRVQRFQALASAVVSAFPHWNPARSPYVRPADDLLTLLVRAQVEPGGAPSAPAGRALWAAAFDEADARAQSGVIDAAWLAEVLLSEGPRGRPVLLDQFGFGQRLLAGADASAVPDAIEAIRSLPKLRILMLTIERIGIRRPAVYAAMARHAGRLSLPDVERQRQALAQFQGAVALIARMTRVGTIDVPAADTLLTSLAGVPVDPVIGYSGGIAAWLHDRLLPILGSRADQRVRDVLLDALAGARAHVPPAHVIWEGQDYSLDLVTSERARMARALDRSPEASIDAALDLYRAAQAGAKSRLAASPAPQRIDAALAEALLAMAYAIDWSDPQGLGHVIRGTIASRHDFGLGKRLPEVRARTPWMPPLQVFQPSSPWHLEGSILGLDLVLGRLALRRVHTDALLDAPTINEVDRDAFISSFGILNTYALVDSGADAIVQAVDRGRRRVSGLVESPSQANEIIHEVHMDGWRARALGWAIVHDPTRITGLFSLTELLSLGGANGQDLNVWGVSSLALHGCLCSRLPAPGIQSALVGRPQLGLLSSAVADLHLRVVLALRELELPASLTKSVLAGALREFLDRVRPAHHDDWLTLVRTAQLVTRERIEDYVASATAGGPLRPAAPTRGTTRQ